MHESLKQFPNSDDEEKRLTEVWLSHTSWNVALQVCCAGITLFKKIIALEFSTFLGSLAWMNF
jgi:hypothetical protein